MNLVYFSYIASRWILHKAVSRGYPFFPIFKALRLERRNSKPCFVLWLKRVNESNSFPQETIISTTRWRCAMTPSFNLTVISLSFIGCSLFVLQNFEIALEIIEKCHTSTNCHCCLSTFLFYRNTMYTSHTQLEVNWIYVYCACQ